MTVFDSKSEAEAYAKKTYGGQFETGVVNIVKIGPTLAKFYGCGIGYAIDSEIA